MTDELIRITFDRVDSHIASYKQLTDSSVTALKQAVRDDCARFREEISISISRIEIVITRETVTLVDDAEYHLLRAYFHASPSLWAIILAIYGFVRVVIEVISVINEVMKVITGETLAYWLDFIIPGFEAAWRDIMNKVSQFSALLGWGVDGVHHLLNVRNAGADLWGIITGRDEDAVKVEKYKRTEAILNSYSLHLDAWQANPGAQIAAWAKAGSEDRYWEGLWKIREITGKIAAFEDKSTAAFECIGTITNELLALHNNMPYIVNKYIPVYIWDKLEWFSIFTNDRLLPWLEEIDDRLDELDAVIEAHQAKAAALADKIAHPGDMLAEIANLPDYARDDQLFKIDSVTSSLMSSQNTANFAAVEGDLRAFALIAKALETPPPALSFMELELPERPGGVVTRFAPGWQVGDF